MSFGYLSFYLYIFILQIEYQIENQWASDEKSEEDESTEGENPSSPSFIEIFRIDAKSGVVTTRSQLDRETAAQYTLIVVASDLASPASERHSSTASLIIHVLDDNDNYPQFTERTYSVPVPEDAPWSTNPIIASVK